MLQIEYTDPFGLRGLFVSDTATFFIPPIEIKSGRVSSIRLAVSKPGRTVGVWIAHSEDGPPWPGCEGKYSPLCVDVYNRVISDSDMDALRGEPDWVQEYPTIQEWPNSGKVINLALAFLHIDDPASITEHQVEETLK